MFWKCRICLEKDKRIADLQSQIESIKTLVFPSQGARSVSLLDLERDKLLSGSVDSIPVSQVDFEREAAAILTGAYDQASQVELDN